MRYPNIVEMCTVPELDNGHFEDVELPAISWTPGNNVSEGSSAAVVCDSGYEDIAGENVSCGDGGNWNSIPTCQGKDAKRSQCP